MILRCIGCGCDDFNTCLDDDGECRWLRSDYEEFVGVCSACPEHLQRWDEGGRTIAIFAFADADPYTKAIVAIEAKEDLDLQKSLHGDNKDN